MLKGNGSFSGKDRVSGHEHEQGNESADARMSTGEMSVMWASSQGGCGPLKRLLKDVETSHLPPSQSVSLLHASATSSAATIPAAAAPSGRPPCFSTTPASSSGFSGTSVPSNHIVTSRPAKRRRPSLTRGSNNSYNRSNSSPSLSLVGRGRIANPSSDVISRVSRSLNEKVMSEYTNSQRRRQTCPPESLSSHSSSSHTRAASFPHAESSNLRISQHQHPVHPMHKPTTSASSAMSIPRATRHTTPITTSPGNARIKALLETIDHAGPFPSHDLPSSSSTTTAGRKAASSSRFAIRKDHEDETRSRPPRLGKALALGMRGAAVQPARSIISPSHAASMVPGTPSMSQNALPNSVKSTLRSPASAASSQMDGSPSGYDNGTQTNKSSSGQQRKAKGYRPSSPSSSPSFLKPGWPSIDGGLEIISDGENEAEEAPRCTEYTNSGNYSSTPLILPGCGEEEADETHVSSDGASSSSYGDIDIDPAALEDACKMYDA